MNRLIPRGQQGDQRHKSAIAHNVVLIQHRPRRQVVDRVGRELLDFVDIGFEEQDERRHTTLLCDAVLVVGDHRQIPQGADGMLLYSLDLVA